MTLDAFGLPPVGHNAPPEVDPLRERLIEQSEALLKRRDELLASAERAPSSVNDDEVAGKVADLIKLLTACHKNAEAARVSAKEPFLTSSRAVDGFFTTITEPLASAKKRIEQRLTVYQREKAEAERRRREEEARRQQAEAERLRKEAAAREQAMRDAAELDDAVTAAALAAQAEADLVRANREATAKSADLSRNRGDYGAVASLRTFWDFTNLDREAIDLDALRHHLPLEAIEKAVRSFVKAGGRELRGVEIFQNTSTSVR